MQPMPAIIEKSIAPPIPSVTAEPAKKPAIPASIMIITETVVLNFFICCKTKPTVVPLKIQASHDITKQKSTPAGMLSFGAVDGTLRSNRPLLALRAARSDCFRFPAGQNAPPDRFVPPASSPVRHY